MTFTIIYFMSVQFLISSKFPSNNNYIILQVQMQNEAQKHTHDVFISSEKKNNELNNHFNTINLTIHKI